MVIIAVIACLNLATMVLARAARRRKELAIRLGVGASRFRLIRQMITEGILLSLLGGGAGFAMAYGLWVMRPIRGCLPARRSAPTRPPIGMRPYSPRFWLSCAASGLLLSLPAVTGFALAAQPPYLPGDDPDFRLAVVDPQASAPVEKDVVKETVGAGFFAILNEPIPAGREFGESDQRVDADGALAPGAAVPTLPLVLN